MRPSPFIVASTDHGSMIVNWRDSKSLGGDRAFGVGYQLLNNSSYDPEEVSLVKSILKVIHGSTGDGVVMLDCGANIGVHTIECAKHMNGWGEVMAFEAQERLFYALAGNIAINNCFNASAKHIALGDIDGKIDIPTIDYSTNTSFGSVELIRCSNENIGPGVDYNKTTQIDIITIDSLQLPRVDFMKIDVEGMELSVLRGSLHTINTHHPVLLVEHIKSDKNSIEDFLGSIGYTVVQVKQNLLCVHPAKGLEGITI